ncbi:hypothetical protein [Brevundimonas sp. GCM10030266]|uniref:hypothetical protein n=1 Tax=Brevundimonas sp. GCM10030266 TaxID=3273386 RepID=UPI003618F0E6
MLLMALLALAAAPQDAGPLEPGRSGRMQCYGPDVAAKTCTAIGAYRFDADGTIWNDARNMISGSPAIVLVATGKVYVRDGAECANPDNRAEEITGVEVNGRPLEGAQFETVRAQIAANMDAVLGEGELCSTYVPNPDGTLKAAVTIGGVARPEFESVVLWIEPDAGWTLALPEN